MKIALMLAFLFVGYGLNAQIKIDPNKIKEKANTELKKKEEVKKKDQKSNSLNNQQQVNRKRPGGTIQSSPSSSSRKEETEPKPKKEGQP